MTAGTEDDPPGVAVGTGVLVGVGVPVVTGTGVLVGVGGTGVLVGAGAVARLVTETLSNWTGLLAATPIAPLA